jgi:uncharacterized protein YggE
MIKIRQRSRLTGLALAGAASLLMLAALIGGPGRPNRASAQEGTPVTSQTPSTLQVTGHGSVRVEPDIASVILGVDVIRPTLNEAQSDATTQMTAVLTALTSAGIADEDIQTVNYSVNIIRNYDPQTGAPAEIQGFQVSNQVNVTIREVERVGEILDAVVAVGANSIYGISFYVEDTTDATNQARTLAVENARSQAEQLAAAAGLTLGRILTISESYGGSPIYYDSMASQKAGGGAPIQAGASEVVVDVHITFQVR